MADPTTRAVNRFIAIMNDSNGYSNQLLNVKRKMNDTSHYQPWKVDVLSRPRSKGPVSTYKLTKGEMRYVLKVDPVDEVDSWTKVDDLCHILMVAKRDSEVPVQIVYHLSDSFETEAVGTKFLILQYVPGMSFQNIQEMSESLSRRNLEVALKSVMKELANLHRYHWAWMSNNQKIGNLENSEFWRQQNEVWWNNYAKSSKKHLKLFQDLKERRPRNRNTKVIHGNLDISNVIFGENNKVAAIIDWKFNAVNGDPLVDVAYFTMMFAKPEQEELKKIPLLATSCGPQGLHITEKDLLKVYSDALIGTGTQYIEADLFYAKAVSCTRLISILQTAKTQAYVGHECGQFKRIKENGDYLIQFLNDYGSRQYQKWLQNLN